MYAKPSRQIGDDARHPGGEDNIISVTDIEARSLSNFDFEFEIKSTSSRTAFLVANFSTWHVNQTLQLTVSSADQSSDYTGVRGRG